MSSPTTLDKITMTDLFCGMGGSSTGAIEDPRVDVRFAANHWQRAVETHQLNHPRTDHSCADLSQIHPRYFPTTHLLWASPECTNHSPANGKKKPTNQPDLFGQGLPDEAAERSRATMWDVCRFTEYHRYQAIIVENVVEAARWVMFDAWLMAMTALGYEHHILYFNSMHAQYGGLPAPQSRDRMYVVFWLRGATRPDFDQYFRPRAYCSSCDKMVNALQVFKKAERWGRYRSQYVYRCPNAACRNQIVEPGWLPAAYAIDWTIRGQRIGDRERPLAPKTMARIKAGLERYAGQRMHLDAAGNTYDSTSDSRGGEYFRIWPETDPLRTLNTTLTKAMLVPAGQVPGAVGDLLHQLSPRDARALVMRNNEGGSEMSTPVNEVLRTLTTAGHQSLLVPVEGRSGKEAQSAADALRTQTTRNETALLMTNNWNNRLRDVGETLPTATTATTQGLLMGYYGKGGMQSITEPIGTLSTRQHHAMITTMRGANSPKHVGLPLDTFAASGNHHGLSEWVVPEVEDCEFRMFEPHEIKRGMAFPNEYQVLGTKREQVKMAGNAVTPPVSRDLVSCVVDSLGDRA